MCEAVAPDVFSVDDEGFVTIASNLELDPDQLEQVGTAVQACPVAALRFFRSH
jgi:ferredoxin